MPADRAYHPSATYLCQYSQTFSQRILITISNLHHFKFLFSTRLPEYMYEVLNTMGHAEMRDHFNNYDIQSGNLEDKFIIWLRLNWNVVLKIIFIRLHFHGELEKPLVFSYSSRVFFDSILRQQITTTKQAGSEVNVCMCVCVCDLDLIMATSPIKWTITANDNWIKWRRNHIISYHFMWQRVIYRQNNEMTLTTMMNSIIWNKKVKTRIGLIWCTFPLVYSHRRMCKYRLYYTLLTHTCLVDRVGLIG